MAIKYAEGECQMTYRIPKLSSADAEFTAFGAEFFDQSDSFGDFNISPPIGLNGISPNAGVGITAGAPAPQGVGGLLAGGGTVIADRNPDAQSDSPPSAASFPQETVTLPGSGLTFINTYDATVASDYHAAIIA